MPGSQRGALRGRGHAPSSRQGKKGPRRALTELYKKGTRKAVNFDLETEAALRETGVKLTASAYSAIRAYMESHGLRLLAACVSMLVRLTPYNLYQLTRKARAMSYGKRTEKAFPFTWAGIRVVPDATSLSDDGISREELLASIDGYVRKHDRDGFIRIPEPGVYCARFVNPKPGELEFLFALMRRLKRDEVIRRYAPRSTWTDPEEGTCPLIVTG